SSVRVDRAGAYGPPTGGATPGTSSRGWRADADRRGTTAGRPTGTVGADEGVALGADRPAPAGGAVHPPGGPVPGAQRDGDRRGGPGDRPGIGRPAGA